MTASRSDALLGLTPFAPPSEPAPPATPPPAPPRETSGDEDADQEYRLHRRFDRLGRLFGDGVVQHLMRQRVVVFGLGGVGGPAAEALARSAIGHLMVVDHDKVCITNTNRQVQALTGTVGKPKADLLAERLRLINTQAKIESRQTFYNAERSEELLRSPWPGDAAFGQGEQWDFVVDCVDNLTAKAHLLATCKARGIPVISSMGAAGKIDPTRVRVSDLADTQMWRLARDMRRILRKKYGFPPEGEMGIKTVWSDEPRLWPRELSYDGGQGFRCVCPHKSPEHGCDSRQLIDGTAAYVTGVFGLTCASVVVNTLTEGLLKSAPPARGKEGTIARTEREPG